MNPRICLYTDSYEPSGMGEHMVALATELRSHYDIAFICHADSGICQRVRDIGFPTHAIASDYWELRNLIAMLRPDVFHCHAGVGWEGHSGVWAARDAGIEVVLRTEHLPYVITERWQHDEYMRMQDTIDAIICVSEESRRGFERAGISPAKLYVVRNGIKPPQGIANRNAVLADLGLFSDARMVLTVGRMTHQKGYPYLLDAVPSVLAQHPRTFFLVAGVGHEEENLKAQVERLGITANVFFLGRRGDVPRLMAACDLFVLPSLFEGLPLVVLEAMSMGKPVIGTRVCGTSEAVIDRVTGALVEPKNALALADAIIAALDDAELRARWGVAGKKRVANYFMAERMAHETSAVYSKLLKRDQDHSFGSVPRETATRV